MKKICDECETVAHCTKHGCIPKRDFWEGYVPESVRPAVPDAFGTREGEHPEYVQGWNNCRAEMLRGTPAQRKPLTDEEIKQFAYKHLDVGDGSYSTHFVIGDVDFARAIEAAHGIKENT